MSDVFEQASAVFNLLMDQFGTTVSTITSNPLLFASIVLSFGGGIMLAGVKIVRRLGVRGLGGRRRRR